MSTQVNQTQDMFSTQNFNEGKTSGEAQNPHNVDKKIVQPYRGQGSSIWQCHFSTACTPMVSSLREFHTTLSSRLIGGNIVTIKQGHVVVADTEKTTKPKPQPCFSQNA